MCLAVVIFLSLLKVLKRALRVTPGDGMEEMGEFGCIQYSGSLDKTQVPFDLYVKVRPFSYVRLSAVLSLMSSGRLLV